MEYYLVVFKAKSETIRFSSLLTSYRVPNVIVSTPRQISVSCGTSVKIRTSALEIAKTILSARQFYTYSGIYLDNMSYSKYKSV